MQQEIRVATLNVCNLAPQGLTFYPNLPPYSDSEFEQKLDWLAVTLDQLDADVIALQEIFSQAILKQVLARTRSYRHAYHFGVDPDPAQILTPSVALISRLPSAGACSFITELPHALIARLPHADSESAAVTRFKRPVLQVPLQLPNQQLLNIFVVHLKSKLPDLQGHGPTDDTLEMGLASLRSLHRRGLEALGLRQIVIDAMQSSGAPAMVLGDFNDIVDAVTTQLVAGVYGGDSKASDLRLYDAAQIQAQPLAANAYTHRYDEHCVTIDHVLVSKHFHPYYDGAIGRIEQVDYINSYLSEVLPGASDHGAVSVQISLHPGQPRG